MALQSVGGIEAEVPQLGLLAYLNGDECFKIFFDSAPFGIALGGRNGFLLRANTALCHMLGYKEEEIVGKSSTVFTFADDVSKTEVLRRSHRGADPLR